MDPTEVRLARQVEGGGAADCPQYKRRVVDAVSVARTSAPRRHMHILQQAVEATSVANPTLLSPLIRRNPIGL